MEKWTSGQSENLSESDSDAENVFPQPKKQRIACEYVHVEEFESLETAKSKLKENRLYAYWILRKSSTETKIFYKCRIDPHCSTKAYLELDSHNSTW